MNKDRVMEERQVTFRCGDLTLEGLYAPARGGSPSKAAVVCHPHPMYGGSMHNNVVDAILSALWQTGHATLRFNFRGVGASQGEYDDGEGEMLDARAAIEFVASQPGIRKDEIALAGYSFGAAVAMRAGLDNPAVARVIAVALPVGMMASGADGKSDKPVLLASGDGDSYSPAAKVKAVAAELGLTAHVKIIAGADHFFGGFEDELAAAIAGALG